MRMGRAVSKNGPPSISRSRGGLTTKIHLLALDDWRVLAFFAGPPPREGAMAFGLRKVDLRL